MHRVKGLEFRYMFLVDVSQNTVPPAMAISSSDDPVEQRQIELNERALLHVAATRAALGLFVTWHGLQVLICRSEKLITSFNYVVAVGYWPQIVADSQQPSVDQVIPIQWLEYWLRPL